ncbi:MAG: hypothetical protein WA102_06705 [Candidatus Methanoperedens sp.]
MLPIEINKMKVSIVVIGFQKEDHKMHPHLYDFLQNLRIIYDDVVYIGDGDQCENLYYIDRDIRNILDVFNFKKLHHNYTNLKRKCDDSLKHESDNIYAETIFLKLFYLAVKKFFGRFFNLYKDFLSYTKRKRRLIKNLKNVKVKYDEGFVLAIDPTSWFVAEKYFPGKAVFWSYDILTKDYPLRIKNGFLEKLITSQEFLKAKALIIQDEQRKKLLEESVGISFPNTIFLPVSLNDSEFCRKASENRMKRNAFSTVNIVQSGWIVKSRWSDQLIDVYQNWPTRYELNLRGFVGVDIKNMLLNVKRKPHVSESIYDNTCRSQILNNYDIGFVGYTEKDSNHKYAENASSQMVDFLRLGIPVLGCGSSLFNDFVNKQNIGMGITSPEEMEEAIKKIIDNYSFFSYNARKLYESRFNLNNIFNNYLSRAFEEMCLVKTK